MVVIGGLHTGPERGRRILVAVPRVVRPVSSAGRLVGSDLAHVGIQQRQRAVAIPSMADFSDKAQHRHAGTVMECLRSPSLHGFNLLRRIALLAQPARTRFARIPLGDLQLPFSKVHACRVPRDAEHVVFAAVRKLVANLYIGGQFGTAIVHPLLPALADHRAFQAVWTVHPAMERVTLQAHPRVPGKCAAVAVQVLVRLVIVVLLDPHDDAVAHERAHATGMRVVRRADVGK